MRIRKPKLTWAPVKTGIFDSWRRRLKLTRYAGTRPRFPYFEQQDDDGGQVGEVADQPEDVHVAAVALASQMINQNTGSLRQQRFDRWLLRRQISKVCFRSQGTNFTLTGKLGVKSMPITNEETQKKSENPSKVPNFSFVYFSCQRPPFVDVE